jgi:fermentation-respiration switch protein FrsA (DUF1100 family)
MNTTVEDSVLARRIQTSRQSVISTPAPPRSRGRTFPSLFSSYRFPTAEYARRAECPVFVMHRDDDQVIPLANGQELLEGVAEPKLTCDAEGDQS